MPKPQVTLRVDGKRVGALDLPNLHETRLATFATEPLISTVELSLSTDKETDRRVCLDALILRWRSGATGPRSSPSRRVRPEPALDLG
jgi:hypothetical protein